MIITALKNEEINKELIEVYKNEVYHYDLYSYDDVIELIERFKQENESQSITLITKEELEGSIGFESYIKKVKNIYKDVRIIVILDKLDERMKGFLFSNEVFEIIEGNLISIQRIVEILNSKQKIIYKQPNCEDIGVRNNESENIIIAKEVIAVYGTNGSGKSFFSTMLSDKLSKILNINMALLDMDITNPSIDILANLEGDNNILSNLVESVDKRGEISDIITKYLIKDNKNSNISYMTNNVSLYECQNKLSNKYYDKIYDSVYQNYDYTIIDLPASPFLDIVPYTLKRATKIFFVVNANYISIRQAIKHLDLMSKLWAIPKDRVSIVVNKVKRNSLDMSQIRSFLSEYNIVCEINYSDDIEAHINGAISNRKIDVNLDKILEWLNIRGKSYKKFLGVYSLLRKVGQRVDN